MVRIDKISVCRGVIGHHVSRKDIDIAPCKRRRLLSGVTSGSAFSFAVLLNAKH